MHFSRAFLATMEGRHLVLAYATVILLQGGYAAWVTTQWLRLRTRQSR